MRVIPAEKVRMIMKAAIEAAARTNDANVVVILMIQAFKDMVEHEHSTKENQTKAGAIPC